MKKVLVIILILFNVNNIYSQERVYREKIHRGPLIPNQVTLGTNVLGWANFATINAEASFAVTKNWSLQLKGDLNPFTYNNGKDNQMQFRQAALAFGFRWWPWHANSGWYFGSSAQYGIYNFGGIIKKETYEGQAIGLNIFGGYALMLSQRFNLELGLGLQPGYTKYKKFACPQCGILLEKSKKVYLIPQANAQLVYIF